MISQLRRVLPIAAILAVLGLAHFLLYVPSEPYYNNDETRHVMTGVFARDALVDGGWKSPRDYAVRYYLQYPALGLLVWPPFFYGVEGVAMTVFGSSFLVSRLLILGHLAIAIVYIWKMVERTHGPEAAWLAAATTGFMPQTFEFSRQVMLEVPTLAWVAASIFHFERYLDERRTKDAGLACLFAAFASLTRYDAILLPVYFAIRLVARRQLFVLFKPPVFVSLVVCIGAILPVYWFTWKQYGGGILQNATRGVSDDSAPFSLSRNLPFYIQCVPHQIGWPATVLAVLGIGLALRSRAGGMYFALLAANYIVFTPMAEIDARHTIYAFPALATFAASATLWILQAVRSPWRLASGVLICVVPTAATAFRTPVYYVHGFAEAAQYVVNETRDTSSCLIDAHVNGGFIYYMRQFDSERRFSVLRADKILFGVFCGPKGGYEEWTRTDAEILDVLYKYDPELIVVEEPCLFEQLPARLRLRKVLKDNPDRFRPECTITLGTNHPSFARAKLVVYRSMKRNPKRVDLREMKMLGLGETVGVSGKDAR